MEAGQVSLLCRKWPGGSGRATVREQPGESRGWGMARNSQLLTSRGSC